MTITLLPAPFESLPTCARLMQLYAYDFSELTGSDVSDDGTFATPDLARWWADPAFHPFLLRVDGECGGFVVVSERSRLAAHRARFDVAEFFVLRKYRRRGVGARAAALAFDRFRGPWEVRQIPQNTAATAFWRRAIGQYTSQYTGGGFREVTWNDARWRGPVQLFDNTGSGGSP